MTTLDFNTAIETQQYLLAKIHRTTKGGWICIVNGTEAFLPGSQLYKTIADYESHVGRTIKVLVQRVDDWGVVVSHKDYVKKLFERKEIIQNLRKGQELTGIVKGATEKGYYIYILGIVAFMPKRRTERDAEALSYGKNVNVLVARANAEKDSLIVRLKKEQIEDKASSQPKSMQNLSTINVGDEYDVRVIGATRNGFKVELADGLIGFLEKSQIPKNFRIEIGNKINTIVSDVNRNNGVFQVSIRQLIKRTQQEFFSGLVPNESVLTGRVVYIERDCVTLHIKDGSNVFSAYVNRNDLAWERVQNCMDVVFMGEELQIRYLRYENGKAYFDLKWQQQDVYPQELFDMRTDELLSTLGAVDNHFIGKVSHIKNKFNESNEDSISGAIVDSFFACGNNDPNILLVDKYTGANISAFITAKYAYGLEDGKYYPFVLEAASRTKRIKEHRPFMFEAVIEKAVCVDNPWKELVEKSFKENKSPKSNRESASYLKEIGADMYADRDRMFYELLQNADDASSERGVRVMIQIKDNYLIFTHDGLSFSRQDFRSIASTAYSTKRLDRKKTGYKGIGFKSVFTDSQKVYIKTGGFFFMFDKSADLFKDFRSFYRYVNPLYTEEQLEVFFDENIEYEKEFEKVDHLPWQLLPFWVDDCPIQLRKTSFSRSCNVAIALDLGVSVEQYKKIIIGIIQKPRFMLFLRNTQRIQFENKQWDILSIAKHTDFSTGVVQLKNSFANDEKEVSYIVHEGNEVAVDNDAFKACDIPMVKESIETGSRTKWLMYQIVDQMQVPITSIPERIIAADTTTLSYAFMLDSEGCVVPIDDRTPSLYAYLPMEDRRYLFPFFINADFELSSNRQEAKRISVWNEYLFYNIGKNLVSWVATLANGLHERYLYLLPNEYLTEELEEGKIDKLAKRFNTGYAEALLSTPFIINDKLHVVRQNDIIIDESGFARIIGSDDFCKLWGTHKRMPLIDIDTTPLLNDTLFTEIEHLQANDVVSRILDAKYRIQLLKYWFSLPKEIRTKLLGHIVAMPRNKKNLSGVLADIPAFTCCGSFFSFNKLLKSKKHIIRSNSITPVVPILEKLGFSFTDEFIDSHPFINDISEELEGYKLHLFDMVSTCTKVLGDALSAKEKVILFKHFADNQYGLKRDRLSNWELFSNQKGTVSPLCKLTHINSSLYRNITQAFVIDENEYVVAPKLLGSYLMKESAQFEEIVVGQWDKLIDAVGDSEEAAISFYQFVSTTFAIAEHENEQSKKPQLSVIKDNAYIFAGGKMGKIEDVIISGPIASNEKIKSIVELMTGKTVPSKTIVDIISNAPYSCEEVKLEDIQIKEDIVFNKEQINIILDYCATAQETAFSKYYIKEIGSNYVFNLLKKGECVAYTDDDVLRGIVNSHCSTIHLMPNSFKTSETIKNILTGDELLMVILESIGDITPCLNEIFPFYQSATSPVKQSFIKHISCINLNKDSFMNDNDINLQILIVASSIEKVNDEFFEELRSSIYITLGDNTRELSDIKLQHTVEVGDLSFPISKLLPNEDKMTSFVVSLKERLDLAISKDFTNKLFGNEIDSERSTEIYKALNKATVVLDNGSQVAFVLEYARTNRLKKISSRVHDKSLSVMSLCGEWYIADYRFIENNYILNSKYSDVEKYLSFPYLLPETNCKIRKELLNFDYVKSDLSKKEVIELLDFLLADYKNKKLPTKQEAKIIKDRIGLTNSHYVLSKELALPSEIIPKDIEEWRTDDQVEIKTSLLIQLFQILDDSASAVLVRKYLEKGVNYRVSETNKEISSLTSLWIQEKKLVLNDEQFSIIKDVVMENDYKSEIDIEKLQGVTSPENHFLSFSDYNIYLLQGEIPRKASIKKSAYVFHTYREGDVVLQRDNIFINEEREYDISNLIKSLINQSGFSADDFVSFLDAYQSKINGSLEGEPDYDLDSEQREVASEIAVEEAISWLSARGYDTSNAAIQYSIVGGVKYGEIIYSIVVKSFRSKKRELKLNPNEWLCLLRPNSRLMLYLGHMTFAVLDRKTLLGNHDFLRLRIATSNFSVESGKLDDVLTKLAEVTQYFERTHFVFEHVHDNILSKANSLDEVGFFESNSTEEFSPATEEDVL